MDFFHGIGYKSEPDTGEASGGVKWGMLDRRAEFLTLCSVSVFPTARSDLVLQVTCASHIRNQRSGALRLCRWLVVRDDLALARANDTVVENSDSGHAVSHNLVSTVVSCNRSVLVSGFYHENAADNARP
jgi:hypothetical protein